MFHNFTSRNQLPVIIKSSCTRQRTSLTLSRGHACAAYRQLREDFFLKINRLGIYISIANCASNASNWYCILKCKNVTAMKLLAKFIVSLFETRESTGFEVHYHRCSDSLY